MIRARSARCFATRRRRSASPGLLPPRNVTTEKSPPDRSARARSRQTMAENSRGLDGRCGARTNPANSRENPRRCSVSFIGVRLKSLVQPLRNVFALLVNYGAQYLSAGLFEQLDSAGCDLPTNPLRLHDHDDSVDVRCPVQDM